MANGGVNPEGRPTDELALTPRVPFVKPCTMAATTVAEWKSTGRDAFSFPQRHMLLPFQVRRPSHQMRGPMQKECGKRPGPALAANARGPPTRSRLVFVQDKHYNTIFLVDTGADVSVLPPTNSERKHQAGIWLQAANNTKINTYGQKSMTLNLGMRRVFPWIFTIADTKYPILGADFLRNFDLLVDIRRTQLVDATTKVEVNGFVSNVVESTRLTVINEVPSSKYDKLLADFPSLTKTNSGDTRDRSNTTSPSRSRRLDDQ